METSPNRALGTAYSCQHAIRDRTTRSQGSRTTRAPRPHATRLESSHTEQPYDLGEYARLAPSKSKDKTVLYLAYGSNLANEKFRGDRGIKPLSQINVQVPSLRMTFDLPGLPYAEPCFANSALRDPNDDPPSEGATLAQNEKSPLLLGTRKEEYRKNCWHKGLIGVVYEVTPEDYAHIIATEGGGAAYRDVVVDCHPFVSSDPRDPVPQDPTLPAFKAHTLFAPASPDGEKRGRSFRRPDPDYAQASARYLKLITDGAEELGLPYEYQEYLHSIRPYTITTSKQRVGQFVFLTTWMPLVLFIFASSSMFQDKNGKLPAWMAEFTEAIFKAVWASYDSFFEPLFGDGERTIEDGDDNTKQNARKRRTAEQDLEKGSS